MASKKLKVLYVSSEAAPFAKSGGLGDVAGSLPAALNEVGLDCRLVIPKYSFIPNNLLETAKYSAAVPVKMAWRNTGASIYRVKDGKLTTYLVENHYYFNRDGLYGYYDDGERFAFFCKAVLEMLPLIKFKPDIIHLNDWQTGPICMLLQDVYKKSGYYNNMKCVFSIHNMQYQGIFPRETLSLLDLPEYFFNHEGMEFYGMISYLKAGLVSANAVSTVSKMYANEIQSYEYGFGMDGILRRRHADLCGIVNGIDYIEYNPADDPYIWKKYDNYEDKQTNKAELQKLLGLEQIDAPLISMITRLTDQKGLDLVSIAMDEIVAKGAQLVFLGTGEGRYEHMLKGLEYRYPGKVSANIMFDNGLAHKIYAGSDFFLMPSLFEPCGLGQLISMRYGSIPIVRKTGGLADTVTHFNAPLGEGTGFVFEDFLADGMMWAINLALDLYYKDRNSVKKASENCMAQDFSWGKSAEEYKKLYEHVVKM